MRLGPILISIFINYWLFNKNIFIISLLLILFSSNVLNLLILLPLTSKYVSWSLNIGKLLLSFSSNLTNKSAFLHGKQ